jgi:iron complex outermembrane recepter protein
VAVEVVLYVDGFSPHTALRRMASLAVLSLFFGLVAAVDVDWAQGTPDTQNPAGDLKQLNLEQLGNVELTTVSMEPEEVWNTPAAIYVLTQDDIRRSGATSIPEVPRLVPGVEVARLDSDHWSVGIRGFGSEFSKSVLVLIVFYDHIYNPR